MWVVRAAPTFSRESGLLDVQGYAQLMITKRIAGAMVAAAVLLVPLAVASPAVAAPGGTVTANFTRVDDTSPQVVNGETRPRGTLTFRQPVNVAGNDNFRVNGRITGLRANSDYVAVLYKDAVCAPTPGLTAFPSRVVRTDRSGVAVFRDTVLDPQGVNPAARHRARETRSVSLRDAIVLPAAVTGQNAPLPGLPITAVPNGAETEACGRSPRVR